MYAPSNRDQVHDPLPPLRSVHSTNLPAILEQLGVTLMVTTYQAGKLVLVRPDNGVINTHFRAFNQPMGLAIGKERLAIGTEQEIIEFRNVPAAAKKLKPADKHDACYLPRAAHVTGNVLIHEMAYSEDELWFVNTRFSCLSTIDAEHSFVPALATAVRYATCPGRLLSLERASHVRRTSPDGSRRSASATRSDGWRQNKRDGGILIDVAVGTDCRPRTVDAAFTSLASRSAVAAGIGDGQLWDMSI